MRKLLGTVLVALAPVSAFAQTAAPVKAEFEVASIRPSAPVGTTPQVSAGVHVDGAMVTMAAMSVKDLIQIAYRLKNYQVLGPDWMAGDRFDISAKLPEGAARADVLPMLQTLLADRFSMKVHHDSKEFPVYALTVAKSGMKMKESPLEPEPEAGRGGRGSVDVKVTGGRAGTKLSFGRGAYFTFADNKIEGIKLNMQQFADTLARFLDRPLVDGTDLQGTYDFSMTFQPEDFIAMQVRAAVAAGVVLPPEAMRFLETAPGDSLFAAIQTIGLKLEPKKAPLEVLVVDSIKQKPTEN